MSSIKETILAAYPPQDGDNWLAVDKRGTATYFNRHPTKLKQREVPGLWPEVASWCGYEHYRKIGQFAEPENWEEAIWKVGNWPEKPFSVSPRNKAFYGQE